MIKPKSIDFLSENFSYEEENSQNWEINFLVETFQ